MSVVSKMQFTRASRSSHRWLSKQPQLVKSSKLVVASLSCADFGTAQPQLVSPIFQNHRSIKVYVYLTGMIFGLSKNIISEFWYMI